MPRIVKKNSKVLRKIVHIQTSESRSKEEEFENHDLMETFDIGDKLPKFGT